jgi:radical SAM protein (TIGR01212 family)
LAQIDDGIARLKRRYNCNDFIAYFQPATNTYADIDRLRSTYFAALEHPQIVSMAIGTRPDCVADDVIDLLSEVASQIPLSVELGVQTIHDRSLQWMNRGHDYACFPDAVERCRGRGFQICTHIILGLPGETHADMMASADEMARLKLDGIKLHNLYAVKNTPLADQVTLGEVELMPRDAYVKTLVDFIERLPPEMVVERVSGEAPPDYFVGPSWCLDKPTVLRAIRDEFERRDAWQGKLYSLTGEA